MKVQLIEIIISQMFSDSIDSKINKIKLNFDSYLNDKKKQGNPQPPVPSVRRPEQIPVGPVLSSQNSTSQMPPTSNIGVPPMVQSRPLELQIKQMIVQGKTYDRQPLSLKNIQKQKTINIIYLEQQTRFKLQIKVIQNGLEIRINQQKCTIEIIFKRATRYKFLKPESGQPKWMTINNELKDQKILLICNKQGKTLKTYFQGMVPEEAIKVEAAGEAKIQEKTSAPEGTEKEEMHDVDDIINFIMPSAQQFADTQKFRRALKDMKEEEKTMILMDIFRIKKQYQDTNQLDRKKLKCPIHACQKVYREISQLKTHLKKHPQLNKHGIELTDYGTFEFGYKALDLALFLGKLYPSEMKKIIKKMKTKQAIQ